MFVSILSIFKNDYKRFTAYKIPDDVSIDIFTFIELIQFSKSRDAF